MAEDGALIACHTVEAWTDHLQKGLEHKKLIVVDFTASWCPPCRFMHPILVDMAKKMPNVTFLKVDVDELKTVAEDSGVEAMPTFMLMKDGKVVDKIVGAKKEELQASITKHASEVAAA
ncbi:Thioredoxin H-type [Euphorbia peplus]|nr:Thioredoxin H-type [Euphorbia peplus]